MKTPPQLSKIPGFRAAPGLKEVESLLELNPEACFLVDRRSQRIQLANSQANELTAYTRAEMEGISFAALFEKFDQRAFWDSPTGQPFPETLTLRKRNNTTVDIQATRIDLAPRGHWALVKTEVIETIQQRQAHQKRRAELFSSMRTISQALGHSNLSTALNMILQAGHQITGASLLSVYLQDLSEEHQNFELVRYAHYGQEGLLAVRLPGQESILLRSVQIWTPGKRPTTSLHRDARALKLGYLATAPLGPAKASVGLIAIAGDTSPDSNHALAQIENLAQVIDALIQFHTRTANLENALDQQERALAVDRAAIDAIEDGMIVLTPTLAIARMNPAAEATLGYTLAESQGHAIGDILIGTASLAPVFQAALQGIAVRKQENIRLYRRSGDPFLAQVSMIPSLVEGQLEGIVVLIQDLSEHEKIENQSQQLENRALLGEVSAIFAHEVRNPINNISTGLENLAYRLPEDDPLQETIARMQHDGERLSDLMKSVLAFSRPAEYEMTPVDLGQLINRLLERLKPRMVQSDVQQFLQVEPSLPAVRGNWRALEQVFTNLISNAIDALGEKGGTIAVKIQKVEGPGGRTYVETHVADNGPGIPKGNQERLFQPFFTTKMDGTGLGLAITKRILTAHKGSIELTSYPGATVFHVQIPIWESP
jgi:PAS domain S-box-containing protein